MRALGLCRLIIAMGVWAQGANTAYASDIHIAVASNFSSTLEQLGAQFTRESGHRLLISSGAAGKLYAQIRKGAPFEIFLSADRETPARLLHEGSAVSGTAFTYALGRIVLWSKSAQQVDPQGQILKAGNFRHLSLANPKVAPYGVAAREVLQKLGLWQSLQPRLVFGENISQAHQFVASGNAELGFVALSLLKTEEGKIQGSAWLVPQELHTALRQDAVLLKNGEKNAAARKFLEYLQSAPARKLIQSHGYELP